MGVTLGVLQNSGNWMGEGDEMIFVDNDAAPVINGTGTEDYFCGAWDFGGKNGATPFAHLYNGAPMIASAERAGGRYCLYRWHANNRGDCFYSVGYWYQSEPFTDFPALPSPEDRIPAEKHGS